MCCSIVKVSEVNTETIDWLLQGDPSIVYLTNRDLLDISSADLRLLRGKISKEGWGQKLLSYQEDTGMWGGGLYGPKWISTHYTLMSLLRLGLDPDNAQARVGCRLLLDKGFYPDGGINHFASMKHSETCVTAMTLNLLCYFRIEDDRIHALKKFLIDQQMDDGGWNCESFKGAVHSSFHTTIGTLEALRQYELRYEDGGDEIVQIRKRAHEFLLCHHLFKSDKTGEVVNPSMTRLSFPPRWKYDIIRSLDYFQEINSPHDPRFCDAITLIKKREKNGRWPLQQKHSGRIFFEMESVGSPSRMNTLRALRILKWWRSKPENSC
jgi:hypothetical protein